MHTGIYVYVNMDIFRKNNGNPSDYIEEFTTAHLLIVLTRGLKECIGTEIVRVLGSELGTEEERTEICLFPCSQGAHETQ
jgi:hypothetical protein